MLIVSQDKEKMVVLGKGMQFFICFNVEIHIGTVGERGASFYASYDSKARAKEVLAEIYELIRDCSISSNTTYVFPQE